MATYNKKRKTQPHPADDSGTPGHGEGTSGARLVRIDEWNRRSRSAHCQSSPDKLRLPPAALTQLSRREKQAIVLRGIFSDKTTPDQLDALVLVLTNDRAATALARTEPASQPKQGGPPNVD